MEVRNYHQNDEVDLYDLLDILLRQKAVIAVTALLVTLLSLGGALYVRSKNYGSEAINFNIRTNKIYNNYYFQKSNLDLNVPDYKDILNSEKNINELMNIAGVKKLYNETVPAEKRNYNTKRKFLHETFKLEAVLEDSLTEKDKKIFKYYKAEAALEGDKAAEKEVINTYIQLLNSEIETALNRAVELKEKEIEGKLDSSKEELTKLEEELRIVTEREAKVFSGKDGALMDVINLKYAKLIGDKNSAMELYRKYRNESLGVEGIKKEVIDQNIIILESSFYEIKDRSKAVIILAAGIVLGAFLGIFSAFIKEFIDTFQTRRKKEYKSITA